jgi:hypothetical protein
LSDRQPLVPALGCNDITAHPTEDPFIGLKQIDFIIDHEHWAHLRASR